MYQTQLNINVAKHNLEKLYNKYKCILFKLIFPQINKEIIVDCLSKTAKRIEKKHKRAITMRLCPGPLSGAPNGHVFGLWACWRDESDGLERRGQNTLPPIRSSY